MVDIMLILNLFQAILGTIIILEALRLRLLTKRLQGEEWLQQREDIKLFETHIRRTHKVDESTFAKMPILEYSKTCGAAKDYVKLTEEILSKGI